MFDIAYRQNSPSRQLVPSDVYVEGETYGDRTHVG
jgi:hypothetical protein